MFRLHILYVVSIIVCGIILRGTEASRIVREMIDTYRHILSKLTGDNFNGNRIHSADIKLLMELHDDDVDCDKKCLSSMLHRFSAGKWDGMEDLVLDAPTAIDDSVTWTMFEQIVDKIYGDMISDDPYESQEIHLSLTGSSSEMTVMWVTMSPLVDPYVEYRFDPDADADADDGNEWRRIPAINYTYNVPQNWWPTFEGVIYKATMVDLKPDGRHVYHVSGYDPVNATTRSSADFSFKAAPPTSTEYAAESSVEGSVDHSSTTSSSRNTSSYADRNTKFAVLADQGTFMFLGFAAQKRLFQLQDVLGIEVATVVGDLSYAGLSSDMPLLNITSEDEFEHVWDLYGIQSQPVAATRPWMVTNGNHERFYNYTAFRHRYSMPAESSGGSLDGFWYSYDYGNVHWISVSSEHDLTEGSAQRAWLEQDLRTAASEARRQAVPWIVLALHKPLYCSDKGTPGGFADALESLCLQYGVDLTLTGHMHCYERIHPVESGNVTCYPQREAMPSLVLFEQYTDWRESSGSDRKGTATGTGIGSHRRWDNQDGTGTADVWHSELRMVDVYRCSSTSRAISAASAATAGAGPVHVVQGNSGGMQAERWIQPAPAWSAVRFANGYVPPPSSRSPSSSSESREVHEEVGVTYSDTFGFGVVDFCNSTHLHYTAVPVTGTIGTDEFWIVKE